MTFDAAQHTLFVTLSGSHAHGTARASSDIDLRGVCVAPLRLKLSYRSSFEQHEDLPTGELWAGVREKLARHPTAAAGVDGKLESVSFDLSKFIRLCAAANPNALEILFADERDWLWSTPLWRRLHAQRHRFLSAKVEQTYLGYALSQLKRIKTHRGWLLNPPAKEPSRADFGLSDRVTLSADDRNRIEQAIHEKAQSWGIDTLEMAKADRIALKARLIDFWSDQLACRETELEERQRQLAAASLDISQPLLQALDGERRYRGARRHWEAYMRWKSERNVARADLEAKYGFDTKHAAHLLRLMRTGIEILQTENLQVRRPDALELLRVRDGEVSYPKLIEETEHLTTSMRSAAHSSKLPADVDHAALDELLFELLAEHYRLVAPARTSG